MSLVKYVVVSFKVLVLVGDGVGGGISQFMAKECCKRFNKAMSDYFGDEFMRLPTADDLKGLVALHKEMHGVPGMFGSLDCMHTYWKNCPVAWQQSFKGNARGPTTIAGKQQSTNNNPIRKQRKLRTTQRSLPQAIRMDYLSELVVACCIIPLHNMGISED